MQRAAIRLCRVAVYAVALGSLAMVPGASAQEDPAHALAEKFSRAAEDAERAEEARRAEAIKKAAAEQAAARQAKAEAERRRIEAQRRADEAEMLKQARAEAEARRAAELKAQKEREERAEAQRLAREAAEKRNAEQARAEAEALRAAELKAQKEREERAEAQRLAREAAEKRKAEQARLKAEQEAARAQAAQMAREAAERRQADARRAEEARKAEAARLAREVDDQRRADEKIAVEAQLMKEQEELDAKRQQELAEIAQKFRMAREARERAAREAEDRARLAKQDQYDNVEETRTSLGGPIPTDARPHAPERVTVLLIVEPRRVGKAPNPVLCIDKSCYVSAGADDDAKRLSRVQALGPANTMGRRAGPCNKQRNCVYRNVYLGDIASIQPVDLGFWGHKRHDIYTVRPDKSCDVIKGRLSCGSPVIGHGYRAWIVPESVVARLRGDALEAALADGLPTARSAALDGWDGIVQRQDR